MKDPVLRYEVSVSIDGDDISWVNGPFPCSSYPGVIIFRHVLKQMLRDNELVVSDY